jgi:hypothetical protein
MFGFDSALRSLPRIATGFLATIPLVESLTLVRQEMEHPEPPVNESEAIVGQVRRIVSLAILAILLGVLIIMAGLICGLSY